MTSKEYQDRRTNIIVKLNHDISANRDQAIRESLEAIDTLFLELIGQNEPLIGDSDQFKITENNKVVRNRVRSELRQIIGKDKS